MTHHSPFLRHVRLHENVVNLLGVCKTPRKEMALLFGVVVYTDEGRV